MNKYDDFLFLIVSSLRDFDHLSQTFCYHTIVPTELKKVPEGRYYGRNVNGSATKLRRSETMNVIDSFVESVFRTPLFPKPRRSLQVIVLLADVRPLQLPTKKEELRNSVLRSQLLLIRLQFKLRFFQLLLQHSNSFFEL